MSQYFFGPISNSQIINTFTDARLSNKRTQLICACLSTKKKCRNLFHALIEFPPTNLIMGTPIQIQYAFNLHWMIIIWLTGYQRLTFT